MEVNMKPVKLAEIPGFVKERAHDEWAKLAIGEFVESGEEAALLSIPTLLCWLPTTVTFPPWQALSAWVRAI